MFFIDLSGIKNSTLRYKVLNLSVILSFLIEGLGFGSSIGGANTSLCMIPPPSTYNGFRIAITSSFAGSILIIIYFSFEISHQVRRKKQNNRFLEKNTQEIEFRVDYPRRETTVLSYISINFLLFHISFFCPYLFGSVGCNGIPEIFILPIGIFWFIQGVINLSYQIMAKLI
ncbi:MAG: hypothetical protein ACXAAI_11280 [Promethearchaeota archaeon]